MFELLVKEIVDVVKVLVEVFTIGTVDVVVVTGVAYAAEDGDTEGDTVL